MVLLLQALAVFGGGLFLARLLGTRLAPLKRLPAAGVGLAGALVAGVLFAYHVYQVGSGLPESTRADAAVSSFAAEHEADPGANNVFLVWARNQMLGDRRNAGGTYYIEPATVLEHAELGQWSTYELLPERATSTLSEATWVIFYGVIPALTAEQRHRFRAITQFAPGFALASRSNAR
jgi:hypothetical protein